MLTNLKTGLTTQQIKQRIATNQINTTLTNLTRTTGQIISDNLFTLFNMVNVLIAFFIALTGSFNNLMFLGPAIVNTIFGIYQEIKAKRVIDQISLVNEHDILALRDGAFINIKKENLVKDDLIQLSRGQQIPADGIIRQTDGLMVNEATLTGEADSINKPVDSEVLSGSYVVSGNALIQLTKVGDESFIAKLSLEVKKEKRKVSILMNTINKIIKILTYTLIPLSVTLVLVNYHYNHDFNDAILGTSAAAIGMIPEGLVLLTTLALTAGALKLTRKKVLVRSLSSIETLARIDVLCLDKTGTITTGNLDLKQIISKSQMSEDELISIAKTIVSSTSETNQTATAIKNYANDAKLLPFKKPIPFSSEKKYSGFTDLDNNKYLMGALEFMIPNIDDSLKSEINNYSKQGFRVISIVKNNELLGLLLIVDQLRDNARETFAYLSKQGISLKVISGDNPLTVANIARQAKISGANNLIDMSQLNQDINYDDLVKKYTVFGRVSPEQKRNLIKALQKQGHTVGMTGDGVNDVLAMKESDCSIAIAGGSEASESAADFVLLNKNFNSMIFVLKEGRRVINNIERVASLYLIKTMYSVILTVAFIMLRTDFPYHPAQLTPINALTVGIPTFFLALQPDYRPPVNRFLKNIIEIAIPAALNIVIWILVITLLGRTINLNYSITSTLSVLAITTVGFSALFVIAWPFNRMKISLFSLLLISTILVFLFSGKLFELSNPFTLSTILLSMPIILLTNPIFQFTRKILGFKKLQEFISKKQA